MSGRRRQAASTTLPDGPEPALRLMIPGPVPLSPACAAEMRRPIEAHYGQAWASVHHDTIALLQRAFGTSGEVLLLVGSGSAALDAAIGSLTDPGDTVVVGVNGYFGMRLAAIAASHGASVVEVGAGWGTPFDPTAFERALSATPGARAVVVTHVETSTGVCNPVAEIAAVARRAGALTVVDAISSLGGMEVAMDAWGVDVCLAASQKCLGGPPGLAAAAVSERAWETIERSGPPRGWYLDLRTWRTFAVSHWSGHPSPVTVPTNAIRALRQGLRELMEEGIEARAARFAGYGERLRRGLRALGAEPLADDRAAAPVVTAARSFPGTPGGDVVDYLEREHAIRIAAGGIGPLRDDIFRVGHMAPGTTHMDIEDVLAALYSFAERSRPAA